MQSPSDIEREIRVEGQENEFTSNPMSNLQIWRQQLIRGILRVFLVLGFVAAVVGSYHNYTRGVNNTTFLYWGIFILILVMTLWRRSPYLLQTGVLFFILYGVGVNGIVSLGVNGYGITFLLAFTAMAMLFLGRRGGIITLGLCILTIIAFGWAFSNGYLTVESERLVASATDFISWISIAIIFLLLSSMLIFSQNDLLSRMVDALIGQETANQEIYQRIQAEREQRQQLESTVEQYVDYMTEVGQGNWSAQLTLNNAGAAPDDDPLLTLGRNLTETTARLQTMVEQQQQQIQVIQAQQQTIQELSTPIIPVMDNIIVAPIVGVIDTARARDITRRLLAGIGEHKAGIAIIDVTGVAIVDTGVANYLHKTIQAARLKGTRVIITGISGAVAETIVDLGIDWSHVETLSDLQMGLSSALRSLGKRIEIV
ncbi:MAG: STAS domain-containing protein [Anaerolineae bacterium]|nr:STAS domain-containing protein [Anaerolineae bacterium]